MAKRYRGRQRMISEAIFESADFDGIGLVGTLTYVGMVIHSDDEGRIPIDAGWLRRRLYHRHGIGRVTTHLIRQEIATLIDRGIVIPCDRPSTAHNDLSYGQITNFRRHNRPKVTEDETRRDKTRQDETRGKDARFLKNWPDVRREDLKNPEKLRELHDRAAAKGWFKPSESTRLAIPGLARNCLRTAKDPVRAFVWRLRSGNLNFQTDGDEERAGRGS